jgi:uncharacterized protein (DUF1810 family)/predicted GNAT family acetyltransferase
MDTYIRENREKRRFERRIDNTRLAAAYYRIENGVYVFMHTDVPSVFSGQGIGAALVRGVFGILRSTGQKAILKCSFMKSFVEANPKYADVVINVPTLSADRYNLERFVHAQEGVYDTALAILRRGSMCSDHMNIIFPRMASNSLHAETQPHAIGSLDEARAYLDLPILGGRYRECVGALQHLGALDAKTVFGDVEAENLHASLTLFSEASDEFLLESMLEAWFGGIVDGETIAFLRQPELA